LGAYFDPTFDNDIAFVFGEDQGRYVVTAPIDVTLPNAQRIGRTSADRTVYGIPLADLRRAHEGFFPALMGADAALA